MSEAILEHRNAYYDVLEQTQKQLSEPQRKVLNRLLAGALGIGLPIERLHLRRLNMNKDSTAELAGLTQSAKLCRRVACFALLALWLGTALAYPFLPDLVPQNFHADGSFRGESPRWQIWLLPVFAALLHWMMNWTSKRPVGKNNIAHIDERTPAQVKARVQQLNHGMIWYLVALLNGYFAWVQSIYIGTATGWWPRMPSLTLWMVLLLSIGIIYYFAKILQASQEKGV